MIERATTLFKAFIRCKAIPFRIRIEVANGCRYYSQDQPRELTLEENSRLLDAFKKAQMEEGVGKNRRFARVQYRRLEQIVNRINSEDKGCRPIVVDGLNALYRESDISTEGKAEWNVDGFYNILRSLREDYSPILVIFKHYIVDGYIQELRQLGVHHFVCLRNTRTTKDDLFVLNAALMLGPSARVLSNDCYLDHREQVLREESDRSLFDEWSRSNFIKFSRKNSKFLQPSTNQVAINGCRYYSDSVHARMNAHILRHLNRHSDKTYKKKEYTAEEIENYARYIKALFDARCCDDPKKLPSFLDLLLDLDRSGVVATQMIGSAVKLLAQIHAFGRPLTNEEKEKSCLVREALQKMIQLIREEAKGECNQSAALLNACQGNFEFTVEDVPNESGLANEEFVGLLGCVAIRQGRLDVLPKLFGTEPNVTGFMQRATRLNKLSLLLTFHQLKYMTEKGNFDKRMVVPSVKLLALFHAQGDPLVREEDKESNLRIVGRLLEETARIPIADIRFTMDLLLNACMGKFDFSSLYQWTTVDRHDCFHLLAAMAIHHNQLDALSKLCERYGAGCTLYSHSVYPAQLAIMEALNQPGYDCDRLLTIYLDQLSNKQQKVAVSLDDFNNSIEPTIRKICGWKLVRTEIDAKTNKCAVCKTEIPQIETLTVEQHAQIRDELRNALLMNKQIGHDTEKKIRELERLIETIKREQRKKNISGRPLVFDGLNALHRNNSHKFEGHNRIDAEPVEQMVNSLFEFGYHPVLLVLKCGLRVRKSEQICLKRILRSGAYCFDCEGGNDDLFTMYAALMLGPEAHVFTNDYYQDHRQEALENKISRHLFDIWQESSFVRFSHKLAQYQPPSKYANRIYTDDKGYHIMIQPFFEFGQWFFPGAKCVRKPE